MATLLLEVLIRPAAAHLCDLLLRVLLAAHGINQAASKQTNSTASRDQA